MLVGNDAEAVAARIAELQAIITARGKALREHGVAEGRFGHDIVVGFDGSRKLRSLPAECQAVAVAGPDGALVVRQMNEPAIGEVRPEYVTSAWGDLLARVDRPGERY